jgi:hypothetical protein
MRSDCRLQRLVGSTMAKLGADPFSMLLLTNLAAAAVVVDSRVDERANSNGRRASVVAVRFDFESSATRGSKRHQVENAAAIGGASVATNANLSMELPALFDKLGHGECAGPAAA